jgi:hypothetical protein
MCSTWPRFRVGSGSGMREEKVEISEINRSVSTTLFGNPIVFSYYLTSASFSLIFVVYLYNLSILAYI